MSGASRVVDALRRVTAGLTMAEDRPGQVRMADAVSAAITAERHLIVAAGTGTGKSLGYLVPVIMSGRRSVVATATKGLQDQLAINDLPLVAQRLGRPFTWAVLKGRSNYICLQRLREIADPDQGALDLDGVGTGDRADIDRLTSWAATTTTGDQAELPFSPSPGAWRAVSVGSDECPGKRVCPMGSACHAETARAQAEAADVVVVNLHLYGLDVASGGAILPEHEVVVIDEAHQLEDILTDSLATDISAMAVLRATAAVRRVIADQPLETSLVDGAQRLAAVLGAQAGQRLGQPLPAAIGDVLVDIRSGFDRALGALRRAAEHPVSSASDDVSQRVLRAQQVCTRLIDSLDLAISGRDGAVAFVSSSTRHPTLRLAPLAISERLAATVWPTRTAILTSATVPTHLAERVGLTEFEQIDVGTPFDVARNGLLYCALHLPDPRHADFSAAMHAELAALITAAGGRTMALFTSWNAMDAAAMALRSQLDVRILTQRDLPRPALVRAFSEDESTCLFATAGFFQGVDIPGSTLSLVTIDRLPFPRPDDPLLEARREQLGQRAFATIDVPRAAMLLAQAAGRLLRTATDRGVVAVFDRRLGTASYRWDIVGSLPPLRRTRSRADAEAFLAEITTTG